MDAQTIRLWVTSLGTNYAELIAARKIPNQPLTKPFEGSNWPAMHPADGLELVFNDETKCLEQVLITLVPTVGQPTYSGDLPAPFSLKMNQQSARSFLGEPMASKGPEKIPGGLGVRGGWDAYRLSGDIHPNGKVIICYLEDLSVNNICFSLVISNKR